MVLVFLMGIFFICEEGTSQAEMPAFQFDDVHDPSSLAKRDARVFYKFMSVI